MYRSFEDTQKIASDFFLLPRACSMFESLSNAFCLLWYLTPFEPLLDYLRGCRSGAFAQNELRIPVRRGENHSYKFSGFFLQEKSCFEVLGSKRAKMDQIFYTKLLCYKEAQNRRKTNAFFVRLQKHQDLKLIQMIFLGKKFALLENHLG